MVVIRSAAHKVAVHDARLVDKRAPADFEVELALWDRRHLSPLYAVGIRGNLDTVTYTRDGFVFLEEVTRDAHQVLIVAQVFGRPAPREKDTYILLRVNVLKRDVRFNSVALELTSRTI